MFCFPFLQQISLSAKFAKEKALGRQIVSVNAFVSSSFQVVAIKTDRKKSNARMASVRVIRGQF